MRPTVIAGLFAAATLAVTASLTGCEQSKVYSLSPDAARSALVGSTIPDIAFGKSAHSGPGIATADGVAWTIVRGSEDEGAPPGDGDDDVVMKLAAKLAPASGGVDVSVAVESASDADPKRVAEAMAKQPAIFRYFRTVAREQVDSVLTHRTFNFAAVGGDIALAVFSNLPNIRKQLDEANAADERKDQETVHNAYDEAEHRRR